MNKLFIVLVIMRQNTSVFGVLRDLFSWIALDLFLLGLSFRGLFLVSNSGTEINTTTINFKQQQRRYSTSSIVNINPWILTGFTDAVRSGCFNLSIVRNKKYKAGWAVLPRFQITLHEKDKTLLEQIKDLFSVGQIYLQSSHNSSLFQVHSVKDLAKIISHFDRYPLKTKKRVDYELFKRALELVNRKEHLTEEGLAKIVSIKASMNRGLSEELKVAFPNTLPVPRPVVENQEIKDPYWLAGFTSGEGSFMINMIHSPRCRWESQVKCVFQLTQHSRDEQLIGSLIKFFDCGKFMKNQSNLL